MTSPAVVLIDNSATTGEINIAWNDSLEDGNWYSYRVYIREVGVTEWTLLQERFDLLVNYDYDTFAFAVGIQNEIAVVEVTQVLIGDLVEGVFTSSQLVTPGAVAGAGYFLVDPDDSNNNFFLEHVTSDSWNDQYETGTFVLINRGRKLDYGTHIGQAGTLGVLLAPTSTRTVRSQLNELLSLRQSGSRVTFIRSPFGDLLRTSITDVQHSRIAAGSDDYMTATISWVEVT